MISWWQHLPLNIDPIAFTIGFFPVRFYGILWIVGFFGAWLCLSILLKIDWKEGAFREKIFDGLLWIFAGAFLGGRFGYALLYMPDYFLHHPWEIFLPIASGVFIGFFGMSFFGGIIGAAIALRVFLRGKGESFYEWADYYAVSAPVALFFGRIGNFFNGELLGRITDVPWGMYFPLEDGILRHPSQLYEASLEGILLFIFLLFLRRYSWHAGYLSAFFLLGYGFLRFMVEFFREPDQGSLLLLNFSLGQVYSLVLVLISFFLLLSIKRQKGDII